MSWSVKATSDFWETVARLRNYYPRAEYVSIIKSVREAIAELAEKGTVEECGWSLHALNGYPFNDGNHFEFHIHDDDVLVVYFKRERKRVIRMVGVYNHTTIPGAGRGA